MAAVVATALVDGAALAVALGPATNCVGVTLGELTTLVDVGVVPAGADNRTWLGVVVGGEFPVSDGAGVADGDAEVGETVRTGEEDGLTSAMAVAVARAPVVGVADPPAAVGDAVIEAFDLGSARPRQSTRYLSLTLSPPSP